MLWIYKLTFYFFPQNHVERKKQLTLTTSAYLKLKWIKKYGIKRLCIEKIVSVAAIE